MSDYKETIAFIRLKGILSFTDDELASLFSDGEIPVAVLNMRKTARNRKTMRKLSNITKNHKLPQGWVDEFKPGGGK